MTRCRTRGCIGGPNKGCRMTTARRRTKGTQATWAGAVHGLRVRLNHAHAWLYAQSGGRLGGSVGGHPILLLTTTGRRTGRERRSPVQYERVGNEIVVVAAGGGSPTPPAWWLNLEADPDVEVRTAADVWHAHAETADSDRRAELWPALIATNPSIESAQEKAGRQLPVVVISRQEPERT